MFIAWLLACGGRGPISDYLPSVMTNLPTEVMHMVPVVSEPVEDTRDLVDVAVPREFRGLWVATVVNLDFPSRQGLSAEVMKAELDTLVTRSAELGFNALIFQVRPEGDALYASELEPWSRYLTGKQGLDPGFDPLRYLVDAAHDEGVEVHAWFNPYRAAAAKASFRDPLHFSKTAPSDTHIWGRVLWLDPGVPAVQDHAIAVVSDVVRRYDIDGVHLDDYFYPYPKGGARFPDMASYAAYVASGGDKRLPDWRMENVDTLVHRLSHAVKELRPSVRFGISPFGIYRPGQPEGISGMDQVTTLHADPMAWYTAGYVDYLAPQLYWPTTKKAQRYDKLLDWWSDHSDEGRPTIVGLDLTKIGNHPAWTLQEIRTQIELARAAEHAGGHIWFRADPVLRNQAGIATLIDELQAEPALPPPIARMEALMAPPAFEFSDDGSVAIEWDPRRALVLYQDGDEGVVVDRILPRDTVELQLKPGTWVLSAVSEGGWESQGVRFTLP